MASGGEGILPDDLVVDVLLRLPAKSLLRSKCVCKKWYNLIQNPNFISNHLRHPNNHTHHLVHHRIHSDIQLNQLNVSDIAFTLFTDETLSIRQDMGNPLMPHAQIWDIVGLVSGLFVMYYGYSNVAASDDSTLVALWNPSTREFRNLPLPSFNLSPNCVPSGPILGFGLDPETDDIKLVWIHYFWAVEDDLDSLDVVVALYSLAHDSWRQIDNTLLSSIIDGIFGYGCIYFNGASYWLVDRDDADHPATIVLFNFSSEVFREVRLPPLYNCKEESSFYNMGPLLLRNDSIALLVNQHYSDEIVESVHIWEMKEEGCWTKLFSFVPSSAYPNRPPLGFWKNDTLFLHEDWITRELILYNTNNHETRNLGIQALYIHVFNYKESLTSVKGGRLGINDRVQ